MQQHQAADQPQPRRHRRNLRQKRDLPQRLQPMRAVMRALDQAVETERLGSVSV
jgi:hypothetical protein